MAAESKRIKFWCKPASPGLRFERLLIMKRSVVFLVITLCALAVSAQEDSSPDVKIGETLTVHSDVLDEDRPYWIDLPASYNDGAPQNYPVLYLLDGESFFQITSAIVQFMSAGLRLQIPELIIVAIPNTQRMRDLTPTHQQVPEESGGGDNFLAFIQNELIPEVDSAYRTLPYRILAGHSAGGLLTLYALLQAPEAFQAYIAMDPSLWWDDQALVERAEREVTSSRETRGSVYISMANYADTGDEYLINHSDAIRSFTRALDSAASPVFRSRSQFFEAEDHQSVPLVSLYQGLLYIFDGYKPPSVDLFLEEPGAVSAHFSGVSKRLGVSLLPPERVVNRLGSIVLEQNGDLDRAIELYELNISNFPGGWEAYRGLAEVHMARGNATLAVEYLEKALEHHPGDQSIVVKLSEARNQ